MNDSESNKRLAAVSIRRGRFFRRFYMYLLAALAGGAAIYALDQAAGQNLIDLRLLQVGSVVAGVLAVWFGLRSLLNLVRWLTQPSETVQVLSRGIAWSRGRQKYKYSWGQLRTYRDSSSGIYPFGRRLLQWGYLRLTMNDGRVLQITRRHGDLRRWAGVLRKLVAPGTGTEIASRIRDGNVVNLHRQLKVWPGGVEVYKQEIAWSDLDVKRRGNKLTIYQKGLNGRFQPVHTFDTRRVDNVEGFLDVVAETLPNYQRERFGRTGKTGKLNPERVGAT
jgi:hypothetical protein